MLNFPKRQGSANTLSAWPRMSVYLFCAGIILLQTLSCVSPHFPPTKNVPIVCNNIFSTCHNPTSSLKPITYYLYAYAYTYVNGTANEYSVQQFYSGSNPSTSMTVSVPLPIDGTPFEFKIFLIGNQCARCALTNGNPPCPQIANMQKTAYSAGYPEWQASVGPEVGGQRAWTVNTWVKNNNVQCGCEVNNN